MLQKNYGVPTIKCDGRNALCKIRVPAEEFEEESKVRGDKFCIN